MIDEWNAGKLSRRRSRAEQSESESLRARITSQIDAALAEAHLNPRSRFVAALRAELVRIATDHLIAS
jgi:hypothetical protein